MTLGQIIKKCRVEKALSQPELADKIGIEQSYLSKLENDKSLPSNDMLQAILLAFDIKLEAILSSIESSSEKKRLKQIPIVNDWYQNQAQYSFEKQRRYLYISSLLIVFGICVFYAGFTKELFSEVRYEYRSKGVVLAGEPDDVFRIWHKLVHNNNEKDKKSIEMYQRSSPKVIISPIFKGESFINMGVDGKRLYKLAPIENGKRIISNPFNFYMKLLGVLLFCSGIMGFVLERKLFK